MSLVSCPSCQQQLDISGIQPGGLFQCPCGVQLSAPATGSVPSVSSSPSASSSMGDPLQGGQPHLQQSPLSPQNLQGHPQGLPGGPPDPGAGFSPTVPPQGMQAPVPSGGPAARSLSEAERLAKVNTGVTFVFMESLPSLPQ